MNGWNKCLNGKMNEMQLSRWNVKGRKNEWKKRKCELSIEWMNGWMKEMMNRWMERRRVLGSVYLGICKL